MKIGIVTFHYSHNYGAILQTFALYKKLTELFPDDEIYVVDYYPDSKRKVYSVWRNRTSVTGTINSIVILPFLVWKNHLHNKFRTKHLKFISMKKTFCLDYVICGSDQIWNTRNTRGFDPNYFGVIDGFRGKILTYAASDGGYLEDIDSEVLKKYISNIATISVREASMLPLLNQYRQDVSVVLDPTLLFDKKFWQNFASKKKCENYILVYAGDAKAVKDAHDLAKKKNAKVISLSIFDFNIKEKIFGNIKIAASVPDFLSYFLYAECVFTSSFHGTVFSIVFEKNFYVYGKDGKESKKRYLRIENLLSMFGLESREGSMFNVEELEDANYDICNKLIDQKKDESISFLVNCFNSPVMYGKDRKCENL